MGFDTHRRGVIAGGAAALGLMAAGLAVRRAEGKPDVPQGPVDITIAVSPVERFCPIDREATGFGSLVFESGLQLTSSYNGFGGLSGLALSADGLRLTALTDAGQWLAATIVMSPDGRMIGLTDARMAPILGPGGRPLAQTGRGDTESLARAGDVAYVGVEGVNEVLRFDASRDLLTAPGRPIAVPAAVTSLPRGKGLEALGVGSAGPLSGSLVAIAERSASPNDATAGFILTGRVRGSFDVVRHDRFDVTDLAFLPDGDMLILERRFEFPSGIAMRIRRIAGSAIRPGARLDGPAVVAADMSCAIDNMEGMAVHRGADGALRVTLVSDDNFSWIQRSLLLRFRLSES